MTPEQFREVERLFERLVEQSPEQRAAYLDEHCDDPSVRQRVEFMLEMDNKTGADFQTPAMARRAPHGAESASDGAMPEQIGGYRLLRMIGRGGMGIVYEAEQQNPRRRVALKVLRPGMLSRQLLQRFEIEAYVLGQLHHPGIAQIYESGLADQGGGVQPFFAMEYIDGRTLREDFRWRDASVRDRLHLMAEVADAVHHAHQKGVIHRDLKPDNILVDEHGKPKILDFGVARATDSDLQVTTLQTDVGQLIGTLPYMSPEQVSGRPEDLDTRSDIYALGAITYELLAGRLPIDMRGESLPEATRRILEAEPKRLSSINAHLRGDLETIVLKAMEKDKERRYQSAAEFADDIHRYLNDEPIRARPASTFYHFRKFAKRNQPWVIGATATLLALVLGLFGTVRFALAELHERREAELARDVARQEAEKLQFVNEFVVGMLAEANPQHNPLGRDMTVREMLDAAVAQLEAPNQPDAFQVDGSPIASYPAIEAEIRTTIGNAYRELGRYGEAATHLMRALELRRSIEPDDVDLAQALMDLAITHVELNDFAAAKPLYEEALSLRRGGEVQDGSAALSLGGLGRVAFGQGDYPTAERHLREAIDIGSAALEPAELASLHELLGALLWQTRRAQDAVPLFRNAVELHRAAGEHDPRFLRSLNNLAVVLRTVGDLDAAETKYKEVISAAKQVYGEEHPFVATSLNNLGWLYQLQGRIDKAEPLIRQALALRRGMLGPSHQEIAMSIVNLARLLDDRDEPDESAVLLLEAIEMYENLFGPDHPELAPPLKDLAKIRFNAGNLDEAERLAREALRIDRKAYGETHLRVAATLRDTVAPVLLARGTHDMQEEVEGLLREALAIQLAHFGSDHEQTVRTKRALIDCLFALGREEEAEALNVQ